MPRLKSWSKEQAKQIANINKAIAEKVGVALSKTMQGEFQEKAKKSCTIKSLKMCTRTPQ